MSLKKPVKLVQLKLNESCILYLPYFSVHLVKKNQIICQIICCDMVPNPNNQKKPYNMNPDKNGKS